jgi:predicted adenylyl cyclase CyaB
MSLSEQTLVELKARADSLKPLREKLKALKAEHIGNFQQTDIYFNTPKGRLKLRQTSNKTIQLIYYEREDVAKPKRSEVFVMDLPDGRAVAALLKRILRVKATVKKRREIYRYRGTQIHLDTVDSLGCYVEFERKTSNTKKEIERATKALKALLQTLEINPKNLEKSSYSDLVSHK